MGQYSSGVIHQKSLHEDYSYKKHSLNVKEVREVYYRHILVNTFSFLFAQFQTRFFLIRLWSYELRACIKASTLGHQ